jgi:signal transduction histidine kinase
LITCQIKLSCNERLKFTIRCKKNLLISDIGEGIDLQIIRRLFTKFATKSETGRIGLGLFISKISVEAHGGRIWDENNKDGKGATFSFTLPLSKKQEAPPTV